jgi:hypothetical protein
MCVYMNSICVHVYIHEKTLRNMRIHSLRYFIQHADNDKYMCTAKHMPSFGSISLGTLSCDMDNHQVSLWLVRSVQVKHACIRPIQDLLHHTKHTLVFRQSQGFVWHNSSIYKAAESTQLEA